MLVAAILPFIVSYIGDDKKSYGYIWITCGSITALATIFTFIFMLETKDKTLQQIREQFQDAQYHQKGVMDQID